jgi:hypothetical protein
VVRCLVSEHKLRFAFTAEVFLAGFHGTIAGRDSHRTNLDTVTALLAELGSDAERIVHVALFAPSDKTNRPGSPDLGADSYTTPAQNTVIIPERIPDFLDPATQGDVLNSAGVGSLGYQKLCEVMA